MTGPTCVEDWPFDKTKSSDDFRYFIHNLYLLIDRDNLWDYLRKNPAHPEKGYIFSNSDILNKLAMDPMLVNNCKSAEIFATGMQIMDQIAHIGFAEFCKRV